MPSFAKVPRRFRARDVKVIDVTQRFLTCDRIQHIATIQDIETATIQTVTLHGQYTEQDPKTLSIAFTEMSVSGEPGRTPHNTGLVICKDISRSDHMRLVRGSNDWLTLMVKEPDDVE